MINFKLNFLHICDSVLISNTGNISVINIFNTIFTPNFPAIHPKFTIFCNIIGDEVGRGNIKISIFDPEKKIIAEVPGEVVIASPNSEANFVANFLNILFTKEGEYLVEIKINEIKINEKDYFIKTKKIV